MFSLRLISLGGEGLYTDTPPPIPMDTVSIRVVCVTTPAIEILKRIWLTARENRVEEALFCKMSELKQTRKY